MEKNFLKQQAKNFTLMAVLISAMIAGDWDKVLPVEAQDGRGTLTPEEERMFFSGAIPAVYIEELLRGTEWSSAFDGSDYALFESGMLRNLNPERIIQIAKVKQSCIDQTAQTGVGHDLAFFGTPIYANDEYVVGNDMSDILASQFIPFMATCGRPVDRNITGIRQFFGTGLVHSLLWQMAELQRGTFAFPASSGGNFNSRPFGGTSDVAHINAFLVKPGVFEAVNVSSDTEERLLDMDEYSSIVMQAFRYNSCSIISPFMIENSSDTTSESYYLDLEAAGSQYRLHICVLRGTNLESVNPTPTRFFAIDDDDEADALQHALEQHYSEGKLKNVVSPRGGFVVDEVLAGNSSTVATTILVEKLGGATEGDESADMAQIIIIGMLAMGALWGLHSSYKTIVQKRREGDVETTQKADSIAHKIRQIWRINDPSSTQEVLRLADLLGQVHGELNANWNIRKKIVEATQSKIVPNWQQEEDLVEIYTQINNLIEEVRRTKEGKVELLYDVIDEYLLRQKPRFEVTNPETAGRHNRMAATYNAVLEDLKSTSLELDYSPLDPVDLEQFRQLPTFDFSIDIEGVRRTYYGSIEDLVSFLIQHGAAVNNRFDRSSSEIQSIIQACMDDAGNFEYVRSVIAPISKRAELVGRDAKSEGSDTILVRYDMDGSSLFIRADLVTNRVDLVYKQGEAINVTEVETQIEDVLARDVKESPELEKKAKEISEAILSILVSGYSEGWNFTTTRDWARQTINELSSFSVVKNEVINNLARGLELILEGEEGLLLVEGVGKQAVKKYSRIVAKRIYDYIADDAAVVGAEEYNAFTKIAKKAIEKVVPEGYEVAKQTANKKWATRQGLRVQFVQIRNKNDLSEVHLLVAVTPHEHN